MFQQVSERSLSEAFLHQGGMENLDVPLFEDPKLKDALRRHYPCSGCCPLQLKQRIQSLCSGGAVDSPTSRTSKHWWRSFGSRLAIAAMMLLAIGSVTLLLAHPTHALPVSLQAAAISRHDGCCRKTAHSAEDVPQDFSRMGKYLHRELKHPVLAADFTKDQWTFRGVAICPVGNVTSAHLLFDQGTRTLSVFSLPAASFPTLQDHKTYEGSTDDHAVVAVREGGAVYCLVGLDPSHGFPVADLRQMLKKHQSEASVASGPASNSVRLAVAIAREP